MNYEVAKAVTSTNESRLERTISRAFLTAHLLTANIEEAESALVGAIDSWNPDHDTDDDLVQEALCAAVQAADSTRSNRSDESESRIPSELKPILRLPAKLRHCYVLRVLEGLSRDACAKILRLDLRQVELYTCAAFQALPLISDRTTLAKQYFVYTGEWIRESVC